MEAGKRARPSVRTKTRAPPRKGAKRTRRIGANRASKQPQQGQPGHFNKLMDSPCTNHAYPVKHLHKDYELLKRFLR